MASKLSMSKALTLDDGIYAEGTITGLYLRVRNNNRSWILRRQVAGRRYEVGLGSLSDINAVKARSEATKIRAMNQRDFFEYLGKRNMPEALTFAQAFEEYYEYVVASYPNRADRDRPNSYYFSPFRVHALKAWGNRRIDSISIRDVAELLNGMTLGVTKNILRVRLRMLFEWCKAKRYIAETPFKEESDLKFLLKGTRPKTVHHGALLPSQMPEFMRKLMATQSNERDKLITLVCILTTARVGSVRKARWQDIDLDAKLWTIPKDHMKIKTDVHVVPLSDQAVYLLRTIPKKHTEVFPYTNTFSRHTLKHKNLEEYYDIEQSKEEGRRIPLTVHGLSRATFRSWASDDESGNSERFDPIVAELCLSHAIPMDRYGGAYNRNKYMKSRRELLQAWADYCLPMDLLRNYY